MTLKETLGSVFYPRCFNIHAEKSKLFTAAAFIENVHVIWIQDEFHEDYFTSLPAANFNRITEGRTKRNIPAEKIYSQLPLVELCDGSTV